MSRYYVFTEAQLVEALLKHFDPRSEVRESWTVRDFLNSPTCVELGMARDLSLPAAPEMKVALDPASLPEPTL